MLKSLNDQSHLPDQVIIVDGGDYQVKDVVHEFPNLILNHLQCVPPSAARQRNVGLKAIYPEITLIGFIDDDIVLEPDALEKMMDYWENAPESIGGTAFNMVNHPQIYGKWLKSLSLTEKLGLYSKDRGKVLPSGFHTMIGYVPVITFVQWLPTGAVILRRRILEEFQFDEWFVGYSYLEDLDFTYQVGKTYQLVVVADARFYHYPAATGRDSDHMFGKREVANRLYFVKKNKELSLPLCRLGLVIRMLISLCLFIRERKPSYLHRMLGNIVGLAKSIIT